MDNSITRQGGNSGGQQKEAFTSHFAPRVFYLFGPGIYVKSFVSCYFSKSWALCPFHSFILAVSVCH